MIIYILLYFPSVKFHLSLVPSQQHQNVIKIICSDISQRQYIFTCNIIHQSQKVNAPLWISSICLQSGWEVTIPQSNLHVHLYV